MDNTPFEHKSGIYVCECLINGNVYVGQSKNVKRRKSSHLSSLRHNKHFNKHFQNSYNKYGEENFEWRVLEYCPREQLNVKERYWIKELNAQTNGFNANEGGVHNRTYTRTEEFRKTLSTIIKKTWESDIERKNITSQKMSGENNPMYGKCGNLNPAFGRDASGSNNGMFGKHHTDEAKEKNRIAHLGLNNKNSKSVVCIETNEIFPSINIAGNTNSCDPATIGKCCRGIKKSCGGFHWRYATQEEINSITHNA